MHAFLVVSKDENDLIKNIKSTIDLKGYKIVEFALQKIEDARNFNSFLKLSIPQKTAIVINNFQNSTEECANAVLKKIEEPQENLIFIIHTKNENSILSTIRSRCQIVRLTPKQAEKIYDTESLSFIKMDLASKFSYLSSLKERSTILNFCDNLILLSSEEIKKGKEVEYNADLVKNVIRLQRAIAGNGNANLHFLNFLNNISD